MAERFQVERLLASAVQEGDEVWSSEPCKFERVLAVEANLGARTFKVPGGSFSTMAGAPVLRVVSPDSIDATEEVVEGDGREWMIGEEPDGSPRIEGLRLGDAVESVVPKSVLTAERERREELRDLLRRAVDASDDCHGCLKHDMQGDLSVEKLRDEIDAALAPLPDRGEQ